MRNITLIFIFLLQLNSFGQNPPTGEAGKTIDSLKLVLKNAKHDSLKLQLCNQWASNLLMYDTESAFVIYSEGKIIIERAVQKYSKSDKAYKTIKLEHAKILNGFGFIFHKKGDIPKAIEYYSASLKILENINYIVEMPAILNNIGRLYENQRDPSKALEHFNKSLQICEEFELKEGIANNLNSIGHVYHTMAKFKKDSSDIYHAYNKKAFDAYSRSLQLQEELNDKIGVGNSLNGLGGLFYEEGNISKAMLYFEKSLKVMKEIGDQEGLAFVLKNIGGMYHKQKNMSRALEYTLMSMTVSKELGYPVNIRNAAKQLSKIYREMNNNKLALENYELFIQMRDSINNETTRKASIKQQLKHEYETKAAADSVAHAKESDIKNAELAKQKAEISAKKNQQYALFGGLGLVMIFAGFMFNRFKVTQKQKRIIEEQKDIVEDQKKLVEEKQKEILDSIHYAKRIQMAQIPNERMVERILKSFKS